MINSIGKGSKVMLIMKHYLVCVYVKVFCMNVCAPHVCLVPMKAKRGNRYSGIEITNGYKISSGYLIPNSGAPQEL